MAAPSLEFLCACTASALLEHYGITRPPVSIWEILTSPPPGLGRDLSLTELLPFGEALWLRSPSGQGAVFVNPGLSEPQKRYALARAMFLGLCSSTGGRAAGFPPVPNEALSAQQDYFARRLLMPAWLLPPDWRTASPDVLAEMFMVPRHVAQARQEESSGRGPATTVRPN